MKTRIQKSYIGITALLMVLLMPWQSLVAQSGEFYSTEDGLSSSLITQMCQDSRGFIWTSTEYGLNRFDGQTFNDYRCIAGDSTSLINDYVRAVYTDSRGHVLIGCINGLMVYNEQTNHFREVPMVRAGRTVSAHVSFFQETSKGEVWMSTSGHGLFRMDSTMTCARSVDDLFDQTGYTFLSNFLFDSRGHLWLGTDGNGLARYDFATKKLSNVEFPVSASIITSLHEDASGNVFAGEIKQGLFRYDEKTDRMVTVPSESGPSAIAVSCLAMVNGRLWVGTDGEGIKVYNAQTGKLVDHNVNASPVNLSRAKVHAIQEDRDGNVWIGLFQKGIVLLKKQQNPFEYYGNQSSYYNPIGEGCVMAVYVDKSGHLWVGADNEGLYELDATGKRLHHYCANAQNPSFPSTILCVHEDADGALWLGTYGQGVGRLNRRTGSYEHFTAIKETVVYDVAEDLDHQVYFAAFGSGFYRYDTKTGQMEHYESSKDESGDTDRNELPNDWIHKLFCDSEGKIWMGHYKGVSCFDPKTRNFLVYKGTNLLISGCVGYAFAEDHNGNLWMGTSDGLYYFNKLSGEVRRYGMDEGLPSNVICGVAEDGKNSIWVSTYKGVSYYDKNKESVVNFSSNNGLQGNEFTHGAYYTDASGKIYFGGIDGVTAFDPDWITIPFTPLSVYVTAFYIYNNKVNSETLSGGSPVVDGVIMDAKEFRLAYKDNSFSLAFSTLQYNNPGQICYQYRIEELGEKWTTTEPGTNRVSYNNLSPGTYTFQVRASNYGQLSDVRSVRIVIASPWYATWWAFCIYAALLALLAFAVVGYVLARVRHRREIQLREHKEQLNEAKLQFFINISHEIRTPMTLIINPLEKLLANEGETDRRKTYLMIYRNAQRILRLINQLMDIRKLDKGQMFMKFRQTDMVGFIANVMQPFETLAQKKQIRFEFVHAMPRLDVWVDMNNFDKVLMNVLSNAFKFTPNEGEITIGLTTGRDESRRDALRDYFEIVVMDSGIGIDKDKIERIFERFYQIDNDATNSNFGTGIGLHLCRQLVLLHHGVIYAENREDVSGSRFIIRIPLGCDHLRTEELEDVDAAPVAPLRMATTNETFEEETPEKTSRSKSRQTVMVVEDEEEIRNYLKQELSADYRVLTCCDGKEAYDAILKEMPNLVISDIMMANMDGLTLCRKLKQNANINHIPIVLLTAKSRPEDKLEGMGIGADAYFVKPFNMELLKSTIANLIANRRLLRNKFSGAQLQEDKIERLEMKSSDEQLMERIMKVINQHLDDPKLNVGMLATEVGLSRVHLHRKLKELTNLSTHDFIKNIRLQQAASLLTKKMPVSEVAYAVGYTNLSHFSNSFREQYGMSPTEYMAQFDPSVEKETE